MFDAGRIGRDTELLAIDALLDAGGGCRALFIEGEAGIGKSTVWGLGVAAAKQRGWRVLSTRGSETETGMSFAGLTDLFDLVLDEVGPDLPLSQRDALELALLRKSPRSTPLRQREVSAAGVALLRRLCADGPVLLALDDVQWVDHATIDAVAFALRRLMAAPVRVLATRRIDSAVAPAPSDDRSGLIRSALPGRVDVTSLSGLDATSIGRLLETRLGVRLTAGGLAQLVERTNGNPFWSLEIGTAVKRRGLPGGELPVPESLSTLVTSRLGELTTEVREALLVCSALSAPTVEVATTALAGMAPEPVQVLDAAMTAGVVQLADGHLLPAHPLLGSIALGTLPPGAKQRLYRRLSAIVTDPEEHARLLALATGDEPDAEVAAALDAGAAAAQSRGAINAAAELGRAAAARTPCTLAADRARRLIVAGQLTFVSGDVPVAHQSAEDALAESPSAAIRCEAGILLAMIECWAGGWSMPVARAEQALRDAGDDIGLQARAHVVVAQCGPSGPTVEFHAQRALALLADLGPDADPPTAAQAYLALQSARLDLGAGLDDELLRQAAAAEVRASRPPLVAHTKTARACALMYVDDLDGSRIALQEVIAAAGVEGIGAELPIHFLHVALTELWAGQYSAGIEAAEETIRLGAEIGMLMSPVYYVRGQLAAYTGDFDWVRRQLPSQLAAARVAGSGGRRGVGHCLAAIGVTELLAGDAVAAAESLREAYETLLGMGIREPSRRLRLESDYAQALIATGRFNEAAALAAELRAFGPRREAPTTRGIALRIEGMVEAGRGNLDRAASVLEEAVAVHNESPIPLERGRTLLALGQLLRRRRAKARAISTLEQPLDCFADLGATPFIELARAELTTLGGAPKDATLTAAEQRAAVLAARGLSNREIATRLFVSGRTVESQLAAVYRKLGVRTRAELTRHLTQSKLHP